MQSHPDPISALKEALSKNLYSIDLIKKDMNRELLSMAYTPGVGEVCLQIQANPHLLDQYTLRPRSIAIVSSGQVLDCQGHKFMPVMDWLIVQIKYYSGYDAFPFVVRKQTDLPSLWKDLSSTYGTVLYLDGSAEPTDIPADLLFIEQHKVQKCYWGDITDARLTAKVIAYCIHNKIKGIPTHQQYTAGIHFQTNNYIQRKTYDFINEGHTINELAIRFHKYYCGKIQIQLNFHDITPLKLLFTEAHLRQLVKQQEIPCKTRQLCTIVTDGTSILGLGNIGPSAGLPVMEGKSLLFKLLGDVEVVPFCMYPRKTGKQEIDAIINSVGYFNAINLEDIKAPECFEVQTGLQKLQILPVFHDDQHGTAVVVLAALINALKVAQKSIQTAKIIVNGAGAAGITISKILAAYGAKNLIVCDTQGAIFKSRKNNMNQAKVQLANITNFEQVQGDLHTLIKGSDVFIGVSKGNILKGQDIKLMNTNSIVFALANPTPQIMPDVALQAGAFIYGSGRSDFPNQINNSLCFPGIFRGIIHHHLKQITMEMKLQAAVGISKSLRGQPRRDYIIPDSLDRDIAIMISEELKPK